MAFPPEINAFWQAFSQSELELKSLPLRERMERCNETLERHVSGLALELVGKPEDAVIGLIVTAHGKLDTFPLLMQLVAAAPPLKHHAVTAFRERSAEPGFSMRMDGFDLATSDVLLACDVDDGRVALEIRFDRDVPQDFQDHARNMVFIMLDHVLGEYDFAVKVGAVDFLDEAEDPLVQWTPMNRFPEVFDAYWLEALGRSGHFPGGEHAWASMTLSFNNAQGGEDDEPEDSAVVSVNRSANAVAMRADLVHALTLDLPVVDSEALSAAQDLHDQAATLLEQRQIGILAYTLVRAGRRKAVYYVGDVELARQTLAPLLLRGEAASQALSIDFDPTWSTYFEYAVHLD